MDNIPDIDELLCRSPCSNATDKQIVEAMVARYRLGLHWLACSMLGDPDEAEDAVQQALLQAAKNIPRYQPGSNFKAWLFTIAVNVCRGMLRKQKARRALARLLGQAQHSPAAEGCIEETVLREESSGQLWAAVERLDDKHRLVVLLRFQQEMTIQEIAQVLSIRQKTVYSRLYEAFHRLRDQLEDEVDTYLAEQHENGG
jgi:RNA polymerase sigma-70 factor, ECF subfamily